MKAELLAVLSRLGFKLEKKHEEERRGSADTQASAPSPKVTQQEDHRRGSA
jgi:hypothetical protein